MVRNARDVGLSPTLGTGFPIFITPTTLIKCTSVQIRYVDSNLVECFPFDYFMLSSDYISLTEILGSVIKHLLLRGLLSF